MSSMFSNRLRSLRAMFPMGSKEETVNFVKFENETTEMATIANGMPGGKGDDYDGEPEGDGGWVGDSKREADDAGLVEDEICTSDTRNCRNQISEWQAGWNVTNAIQGMFIVTFPYAVFEGGYLSLASMVIIAYICCYTGKILVDCLYEETPTGRQRVRDSYVAIAETVWGARFGGRIVNAAQILELLMTCILYVLLCGDLLIGSFPDTPLDLSSWIMLSAAMLLPCAFLRSLRHVSWLSFWCTVAHMFINAIIIIYCLTRVRHWYWRQVSIGVDIRTFPISLGIVIFSYTSQIFLPTLEGNLRDRSKFKCMLYWTHFAAGLFKALFSYIGFLTWGYMTQEVITNNLPNHTMKVIVNLFLVAKALLSYPLPYYAAAELLEATFFKGKPATVFPSCLDDYGSLKAWGLALRIGLVILTLLMAIFIPHFAILMGLIGSFTGNMLSLVWPCYFHLKIKGPRLRWYQKAGDIFIILLGFVCAVIGVYFSSKALVRAFQGHEPRPFQGNK